MILNRHNPNELNWWIDPSGAFHAQKNMPADQATPIAQGVVDPERKLGAITHFRGRSATLSLVPHEIYDQLDSRYPGTRWWVADPNTAANPVPAPSS